jgi:hypothetical protein
MATANKRKMSLEKLALEAGTKQTQINLFWTFDIYGRMS